MFVRESRNWVAGWWTTCLLALAGCSPLDGVPVGRVPVELLARPKENYQSISPTRLRQDLPHAYLLGPGDTLGVYIETILGEQEHEVPVVQSATNRPPAVGYPIVVGAEGTIRLPLINPLAVEGMSLDEARNAIQRAYVVDKKILPPGRDRILVSLIRPRTYRVLVIRQETGATSSAQSNLGSIQLGNTKRGTGYTVDLEAFENDVMHALTQTGGMPGEDAKNELIIYRGLFADAADFDQKLASLNSQTGICTTPNRILSSPNVIRIPLRFDPEDPPAFGKEDIILKSGDVLVIEARETEVFYPGGVLGGQQIPLPRDYDLDVLEAIALATGSIGGPGTGLGNLGRGGILGAVRSTTVGVPPTRVHVIRQTPTGQQLAIRVNVKKCMIDPNERILMQPGDILLLQYTLAEEAANAILGVFSFSSAVSFSQNKSF